MYCLARGDPMTQITTTLNPPAAITTTLATGQGPTGPQGVAGASIIFPGVAFVSSNGNDSTALVGRRDRPYLTIPAAHTAIGATGWIELGDENFTIANAPTTGTYQIRGVPGRILNWNFPVQNPSVDLDIPDLNIVSDKSLLIALSGAGLSGIPGGAGANGSDARLEESDDGPFWIPPGNGSDGEAGGDGANLTGVLSLKECLATLALSHGLGGSGGGGGTAGNPLDSNLFASEGSQGASGAPGRVTLIATCHDSQITLAGNMTDASIVNQYSLVDQTSATLEKIAQASGEGVTGTGNFIRETALNAKANASHIHGNISNAGAIGSTANLPVITSASGVLVAGSFGTAANTFTQGNDSRLTGALAASTAATTYQPLDSDLTAIAALSTTAFGRALLALLDAAAARTALGLGNVENVAASTTYVNLTGNQTVAGTKTFSGSGTIGGTLYNASAFDRLFVNHVQCAGGRISLDWPGFAALGNGIYGWTGTTGFSPYAATVSRSSDGVVQIGTTGRNALGSLLAVNTTLSGLLTFTGYTTGLLPAATANRTAVTYDLTLDKHVGSNGTIWNVL